MTSSNKPPATRPGAVSEFLQKVSQTPVRRSDGDRGRLVFALDATASREPTWDSACRLQGEMFQSTGALGGLDIQLCYYRGFGEFQSSEWCSDAASLLRRMTQVRCLGGHTQIHRVLEHALLENGLKRVQAIVFVGDALEEDADALCHKAGQLGIHNVPLFIFQEGQDPTVRSVYQQMARLSGGAYAPFDSSSAEQLKELLSAVAVFAAGGRKALEDFSKRSGKDVQLLTQQLK